MRRIMILLFSLVLFYACVEDFNLKVKDGKPRLVVEGLITNQPGPYYVRLTKSTPGGLTSNLNFSFPSDNAEPIENALVIISDDFGNRDTLKPCDGSFDVDIFDGRYNKGFYRTSKIKGQANRSYYLKIIYLENVYTASCYMPEVPKIDSISYSIQIGKDGEQSYIPKLYFRQIKRDENYYLIQTKDDLLMRIYAANTLWYCSILDGSKLNPVVDGMVIGQGITPRAVTYHAYWPGDSIVLTLSSLTKESYNYYKLLIDQFYNDGGTYKPTPASPPCNISNGALGFFSASAVSRSKTYIPK